MDIHKFYKDLDAKLDKLPEEEFLPTVQAEFEKLGENERESADKCFPSYMEYGLNGVLAHCVVVLMHGIRDHAIWHDDLKNQFADHSSIARTYSVRYEFVDMWDFLRNRSRLPDILSNVTSQLNRILDSHDRQRVVLIAHSFGTYLLSLLFKAGAINRIDGVIFCGSIVSASYSWSGLSEPLRMPIVNDCGLRDHYPVLAHAIFHEFGTAGKTGFVDGAAVINRYHDCGHSDYYGEDFVKKHWLPYIVRGRSDTSDLIRPTPGWFLTLICSARFTKIFRWVVIPLIILAVFAVLLGAVWVISWI